MTCPHHARFARLADSLEAATPSLRDKGAKCRDDYSRGFYDGLALRGSAVADAIRRELEAVETEPDRGDTHTSNENAAAAWAKHNPTRADLIAADMDKPTLGDVMDGSQRWSA